MCIMSRVLKNLAIESGLILIEISQASGVANSIGKCLGFFFYFFSGRDSMK